MIPIVLILALLSLAVPVLVHVLKISLQIPSKYQPLLPLVVGICISMTLYFVPRLALTLNEAILLGLASGGVGVILYDFISGLKKG